MCAILGYEGMCVIVGYGECCTAIRAALGYWAVG